MPQLLRQEVLLQGALQRALRSGHAQTPRHLHHPGRGGRRQGQVSQVGGIWDGIAFKMTFRLLFVEIYMHPPVHTAFSDKLQVARFHTLGQYDRPRPCAAFS